MGDGEVERAGGKRTLGQGMGLGRGIGDGNWYKF